MPVREWGLELLSALLPLVRARMEAEDGLVDNLNELHVFVDKWFRLPPLRLTSRRRTAFLEARDLPRPGVAVDRGS